MEKITCIKTSDGKIFEDEKKAKKHDAWLKLQRSKGDFCDAVVKVFVDHLFCVKDDKKLAEELLAGNLSNAIGNTDWESLYDFACSMFDLFTEYNEEMSMLIFDFNVLKSESEKEGNKAPYRNPDTLGRNL